MLLRRLLNWAGPRFIFGRSPEPRTMVDFTIWDIFRNLLLAARWTVLLSLIAFVGGGLVGMALLVARIAKIRGAATRWWAATCSCSRARRC